MTESANQGSPQTKNSLVSYSGLEEYLPGYRVTPALDQESHAIDCLTKLAVAEWRMLTSFQVEFQTRRVNDCTEQRLLIHNLHTGAIEIWSGLETEQLQQWITEQTCPKLPLATVQIQQVQVWQAPQPGTVTTVGDRSLQAIRANHPFTLKILSQFKELPIELNDGSIVCQVQCSARNLATGEILDLQNNRAEFYTVKTSTEAGTYQSQLPEMTLPESGVYRLSVALSILECPDLSTLFRPTALRVV